MGKPSLQARFADNYDESYSDRGTGSKQDLSVWKPRLLEGEFRIVYSASNSRTKPTAYVPVVKDDSAAKGSEMHQALRESVGAAPSAGASYPAAKITACAAPVSVHSTASFAASAASSAAATPRAAPPSHQHRYSCPYRRPHRLLHPHRRSFSRRRLYHCRSPYHHRHRHPHRGRSCL